MSNEVAVIALEKRYKKLEKDLTGKAQKTLLFLKQHGVGLEIYLVPSATMRKLNRQYRGKNIATNVLAYGAPKSFPWINFRSLGEVYLCPSYIKTHREDIGRLLVHGMLHLMGFNHANVDDRIIMEKVEEALAVFLRERSERGRKPQPRLLSPLPRKP